MDSGFDRCGLNLLCTEDNSIFDETEYSEIVDQQQEEEVNNRGNNQSDRFDGMFPLQSEEILSSMLAKECQFMPSADYLNKLRNGESVLQGRKKATDWIQKVVAHYGFGPLCAYLTINYLDRFLSSYEYPKDNAWMMQLLAVACLSLAAKFEEIDVPLTPDLQIDEPKFVFEAKTILRMELLVLSTLKWRMQAVTPFSFTDTFIHRIHEGHLPSSRNSLLLAMQLILSTIKGIDFLEFRPSEIAAAVAILASNDKQAIDIERGASVLPKQVDKGRVVKCLQLFHELALISGSNNSGNGPQSLVPESPVGVVDAACFSKRSNITVVGSRTSSTNSTDEHKRKKQNTTP